ncbi:MAG: KTSC domain-containing protein [Verrucomicrobia bacterium]|nr:KTSC domain-containing protein [Verrucomicrobiota bacterium]
MRIKWILIFFAALALAAPAVEPVTEDLYEREDLPTLQSSWISQLTYYREKGGDSGMLVVEIKGKKITYLDVPETLWQEFRQSESPGSLYGKRVKNRFERVEGDPLWMKIDTAPPETLMAPVTCAFNEECEAVVVQALAEAQTSVRVAAYAFTRSRIARALVEARQRGVDIQIKMDSQQAEYPLAVRTLDWLRRQDIPITLISMTGDYAAMHNKFMVIDDRIVVTGSFNYTTTAVLANWENLVRIDSPEIAARYAAYWNVIASN